MAVRLTSRWGLPLKRPGAGQREAAKQAGGTEPRFWKVDGSTEHVWVGGKTQLHTHSLGICRATAADPEDPGGFTCVEARTWESRRRTDVIASRAE